MPITSLIEHAINGDCELTTERLIGIGYITQQEVDDIINKGIGRETAISTDSNTE